LDGEDMNGGQVKKNKSEKMVDSNFVVLKKKKMSQSENKIRHRYNGV
jgi:hypothetical protein